MFIPTTIAPMGQKSKIQHHNKLVIKNTVLYRRNYGTTTGPWGQGALVSLIQCDSPKRENHTRAHHLAEVMRSAVAETVYNRKNTHTHLHNKITTKPPMYSFVVRSVYKKGKATREEEEKGKNQVR